MSTDFQHPDLQSGFDLDIAAIILTLPEPEATQYPYELLTIQDKTAFLAGQIPKRDGKLVYAGIVGQEITVQQAQTAARICAEQALAWLNRSAGGLENLDQILRLTCYVAHQDGFDGISEVANGASSYLNKIFGTKGRHARSVIGVKSLPRNSPVLIELTAALFAPIPTEQF